MVSLMSALVILVNYLNVKIVKMDELERIVNCVPISTQSSICPDNVQSVIVMATHQNVNSIMVKLNVLTVSMVRLVKNAKTVSFRRMTLDICLI